MKTDTAISCTHCSLPVPAGLVEHDAEHQFCCDGCRTVYSLLADGDMTRYYDLRDPEGVEPARISRRSYDEFGDAAFTERHCSAEPGGRMACELYVENIHCAACVWLIEKLPRLRPGVLEARLNMAKSLVRVTWDPTLVDLPGIARTLDQVGYPPHPARGADIRAARTRQDRRAMIRLAVAGACAGNAMLLAFALYAGMLSGIDTVYEQAFRWFSLLAGAVSLAWPGAVFFRGAWAAIRTRTPHMDIPVALGLTVGGVSGAVNTLTAQGDIYFDSLTTLVFLLLVGRFIQGRQQRLADDAVALLFSLTPAVARRVEADGSIRDVPADSLQPGDRVEVRGGELAPADGTVLTGSSRLDQSMLTGESRPVPVGPGDAVCAGTQNTRSPLTLEVTAAGEDTRVAKLLALVTACSQRRAPIVQAADRLAGWFVVCVLALAGITVLLWWPQGLSPAADHAVALLIVACPCALGLATPLAMAVSLGRAARRHILVKGADTLERLAQPGLILLDKTGTLTTSRLAIAHWTGDDSAKPLVAALERASNHPLADAFISAWDAGAPDPEAVEPVHAGGIMGTVDSRRVVAASPRAMEDLGLRMPAALQSAVDRSAAFGHTPVVVAVDGVVLGVAACGDVLRPDSRATLDALRASGWRVGILSGDHPEVVANVAAALDIHESLTWGGCTPEQKLAVVEAALPDGPVVMVGDGVNDAAALAAATVGIAVEGGAEASLAAADVYLSRPGLAPIVDLIGTASATVRRIHRNLGVSLTYNVVAVALAMTGILTPLLAAIIMPLSSLTVLTLSFTGGGRHSNKILSPTAAATSTPDLRGAPCP